MIEAPEVFAIAKQSAAARPFDLCLRGSLHIDQAVGQGPARPQPREAAQQAHTRVPRQPHHLDLTIVALAGHGQPQSRAERGKVGEEHSVHVRRHLGPFTGRLAPAHFRGRRDVRREQEPERCRTHVREGAERSQRQPPRGARRHQPRHLDASGRDDADARDRADTMAVHLEQIHAARHTGSQRSRCRLGIAVEPEPATEVVATAAGKRDQRRWRIAESVDGVVHRAVAAGHADVAGARGGQASDHAAQLVD